MQKTKTYIEQKIEQLERQIADHEREIEGAVLAGRTEHVKKVSNHVLELTGELKALEDIINFWKNDGTETY